MFSRRKYIAFSVFGFCNFIFMFHPLNLCLDVRLGYQTHVERTSYCENREATNWSLCMDMDLPWGVSDATTPPNTR